MVLNSSMHGTTQKHTLSTVNAYKPVGSAITIHMREMTTTVAVMSKHLKQRDLNILAHADFSSTPLSVRW